MIIEAGKYYLDTSGQCHGPMGFGQRTGIAVTNSGSWSLSGQACEPGIRNLNEEVDVQFHTTSTGETLSGIAALYRTSANKLWRMNAQALIDQALTRGLKPGPDVIFSGIRLFVPRCDWSDKKAGPVRRVNSVQIVPGTYGRLKVVSGNAHYIRMVVSGAFNAAELRKLASQLTEIADALDEESVRDGE